MMNFESPRFAGDALLESILNDPDTGALKLGPGSPPDSVSALQQALWDLHWVAFAAPGTLHADFVIGIYGPLTKRATKEYKKHYDIHFPPDAPTGFIDEFAGPRTFRRLDRHCVVLDLASARLFTKFVELRDAGMDVTLPPVPDPQAPRTRPVTKTPGATRQVFIGDDDDGHLYFRAETGAFLVSGAIDEFYRGTAGGPSGSLGFPTSDEFVDDEGNSRNEFEGGALQRDPLTEVVTMTTNGVVVDFGDELSRF
jgi:hypothetical protein